MLDALLPALDALDTALRDGVLSVYWQSPVHAVLLPDLLGAGWSRVCSEQMIW